MTEKEIKSLIKEATTADEIIRIARTYIKDVDLSILQPEFQKREKLEALHSLQNKVEDLRNDISYLLNVDVENISLYSYINDLDNEVERIIAEVSDEN